MHAAALAAELEISRIVCPRASGVLSALGLIAAGRRRDTARTVLLSGDEITAERLASEVERRWPAAARRGMEGAELEVVYELRYRGQAFELPIPGPPEPDPAQLAEDFAREHEARYGYRDPEGRAGAGHDPGRGGRAGARAAPRAPRRAAPSPRASAQRPLRRRLGRDPGPARRAGGRGSSAEGPCVFELPEATLVLPPGWSRHGRRGRDDRGRADGRQREAG